MKRTLSILVLLILSTTVYAQIDTSGLTPEQKAELQLQAEQMKKKKLDAAEVGEYAVLGQQVAKAIGAACKELNVAVNDFAATPVGKMTIVLIMWKVAGREVAKIVTGGILFVILISIWIYLFRRMCVIKEIKYKDGKKDGVVYYNSENCSSDLGITRVIMGIALLVSVVACSLIMFIR